MTVSEAAVVFENIPSISNKMKTLTDVGLGYVHLGQPATTLSGGEAQRIKLASELSKRSTGKTVYILDEPTTGLSFDDAAKLMIVLHRLVDAGNSIILIEHHLDLIKKSSTGQYLAEMNGITPSAKAAGTTKARKFKTSVNGTARDEVTLPDRPSASANGASKSRRNTGRYRRRRRGAPAAQ